MNYIGIDYHKRYSHVTAVNQEGRIVMEQRLNNDAREFREFIRLVGDKNRAVLESTRTWGVMYDMLEEMEGVEDVKLAHPLKVRMIAEAKIKTDKIDSETLAQLLRADLIPAAYIPSKGTRLKKEMIRQRVFLVRLRTRLKNRIHVLADRLQIPMPEMADIFSKRGLKYLMSIKLEGIDKELLRGDLVLLEVLNRLIKECEREISEMLLEDRRVSIIGSAPGFGAILAAVAALEIDDIGRFPSPRKLASYMGLVPSTYSSGGKTYHGKLIRMSNKWLKWVFIEAAWAAIRTSPYCRFLYERMRKRKGSNIAITVVAKRLAVIVWWMLKENRFYEERPVQPVIKMRIRDFDPAALSVS